MGERERERRRRTRTTRRRWRRRNGEREEHTHTLMYPCRILIPAIPVPWSPASFLHLELVMPWLWAEPLLPAGGFKNWECQFR